MTQYIVVLKDTQEDMMSILDHLQSYVWKNSNYYYTKMIRVISRKEPY